MLLWKISKSNQPPPSTENHGKVPKLRVQIVLEYSNKNTYTASKIQIDFNYNAIVF